MREPRHTLPRRAIALVPARERKARFYSSHIALRGTRSRVSRIAIRGISTPCRKFAFLSPPREPRLHGSTAETSRSRPRRHPDASFQFAHGGGVCNVDPSLHCVSWQAASVGLRWSGGQSVSDPSRCREACQRFDAKSGAECLAVLV